MNGCGNCRGFTLIELMVAALVASVLALTAGLMIVFMSQAWQRHLVLAELQGDIQVAVPTISMAIREARSAEVTAPAVGGSGTRLTMGTRSFYRANAALAFDAAGQTLAYDPNTGVAGNEIALSRGRVNTFMCSNASSAVSFRLVLTADDETLDVGDEVVFRNGR